MSDEQENLDDINDTEAYEDVLPDEELDAILDDFETMLTEEEERERILKDLEKYVENMSDDPDEYEEDDEDEEETEEDILDFNDPYWQELVGEINRAIRTEATLPYIPEEDVDA